jgi:hypothetical protein
MQHASNSSREPFRLLRVIAFIAVLAGASGSLAFTLYAGRHNRSAILPILFAGWVLSPFAGLLSASNVYAKRWSDHARLVLYSLMLVLAFGSVVSYSGILNPRDMKPAFIFLIVPLVSWLVIVIVIAIARSVSTKSDKV